MDLDLKSYLAMATGEDLIRTIMSEDFPDDLVILDWSDKASSSIMEPKSFGDKFFLDSVMDFSKTLLLSKQILNQDTIEIKVDYMVSIDSNVIGHIVSDIFKNRSNNQALIEAINYVTEKRMRIDVNPYLIETQLFIIRNIAIKSRTGTGDMMFSFHKIEKVIDITEVTR